MWAVVWLIAAHSHTAAHPPLQIDKAAPCSAEKHRAPLITFSRRALALSSRRVARGYNRVLVFTLGDCTPAPRVLSKQLCDARRGGALHVSLSTFARTLARFNFVCSASSSPPESLASAYTRSRTFTSSCVLSLKETSTNGLRSSRSNPRTRPYHAVCASR